MLNVTIHAGPPDEASFENRQASLDIAYAKKDVVSDYLVALSVRDSGEVQPLELAGYPRWSASLYDLIARALALALYRNLKIPKYRIDRRCAYAREVSLVIRRSDLASTGAVLGIGHIVRSKTTRSRYHARFEEDVLGAKEADFEYGPKVMNPADFVLRAICHAHYGAEEIPTEPAPIIPSFWKADDGAELFHVNSLREPARTGFQRFMKNAAPAVCDTREYIRFMRES